MKWTKWCCCVGWVVAIVLFFLPGSKALAEITGNLAFSRMNEFSVTVFEKPLGCPGDGGQELNRTEIEVGRDLRLEAVGSKMLVVRLTSGQTVLERWIVPADSDVRIPPVVDLLTEESVFFVRRDAEPLADLEISAVLADAWGWKTWKGVTDSQGKVAVPARFPTESFQVAGYELRRVSETSAGRKFELRRMTEEGSQEFLPVTILVTNEDDSAPLPGAIGWVSNQPGCASRSDENGRLIVRVRPGEPLRLRVEAAGFRPEDFEVEFEVESSQKGVLALTPGPAQISGRTVDQSGHPVANVIVASKSGGRPVVSDDAGRFVLRGLAYPEIERLATERPSYLPTTLTASSGLPHENEARSDVGEIVLRKPWAVRGRAIWESGEPASRLDIEVTDTGLTTVTGPSGSFSLGPLPDGHHILYFKRSGEVVGRHEVVLGSRVENPLELGDLSLPSATRVVVGTVIDSTGNSIDGAEIFMIGLYDHPGQTPEAALVASAVTDPAGSFEIKGVDEGHLEIEARHPGFFNARIEIPESRANWQEVFLKMSEAFAFEGRVEAPDGSPLEYATIFARLGRRELGDKEFDRNVPRHSYPTIRTSAEDGTFDLPVSAGQTLELNITAPGFAALEAKVQVIDETSDLERTFRLVEEAHLSGLLLDADGAPVSTGAQAHIRGLDDRLTWFSSVGNDGRFAIGSIPVGRHRLEVQGRDFTAQQFEIELERGLNERVFEITDEPEYWISGIATLVNGTPASGVRIVATGRPSGFQKVSTTDQYGQFHIDGLPSARYSISVDGRWMYSTSERQVFGLSKPLDDLNVEIESFCHVRLQREFPERDERVGLTVSVQPSTARSMGERFLEQNLWVGLGIVEIPAGRTEVLVRQDDEMRFRTSVECKAGGVVARSPE